ncbi:MAG: ADP-ribosyltransferase [Spirulina sp.]
MKKRVLGLDKKTFAKVEKLTGMYSSEIETALVALESFTVSGYKNMRERERNGRIGNDIKTLNRFLHQMPAHSGEIYRGLAFKTSEARQEFIQKLEENGSYTLEAISSFTSDIEVAKVYAGKRYPVLLRVRENHSGVSIEDFSAMYCEKEILLPKGTQYEVLAISQSLEVGEIVAIDLLEISPSP